MFVNFAKELSESNTITATFKECDAIAIYGGADYDGTPKIVELDENGKFELKFEYGEGVFVTPLTK